MCTAITQNILQSKTTAPFRSSLLLLRQGLD